MGRWVSEALLVAGYRVHAVYRHDIESADRFVAEMNDSGLECFSHQADMTQASAACDVITAIAEAEGGINTLVCSAGASLERSIIATSGEELEILWRSNMLSVHHAVLAAVPYLRLTRTSGVSNELPEQQGNEDEGGRIILFASAGVDSGKAFRSIPLYAACKRMLLSYARSLALELAPAGITVNCLAPGISELPAENAPVVAAGSLPSGRAVKQQDLAAALWYLVSPHASQVTGSVITFSGGFGL